jgi:hypothetical protein
MNLKVVSLILCFSLGIAIGAIHQANQSLAVKDKQIEQLKVEADQVSYIAYQDCQVWSLKDRSIQQMAGCYKGMEVLCMRVNKPFSCMERFNLYCQQIKE